MVSFIKEQVEAIRDLVPYLEIDVMFIKGYINPFNYLKAIFSLRRLVKEISYDLIHTHYGLSGLVSLFRLRIPVICTFRGSDVLFIWWQSLTSRIVVHFLGHSIAVSEGIKKKLPTKKISVIPCGVDLEFFKPIVQQLTRRKLKLDLNKKYLLFPGNPSKQVKNYPLFNKVLPLAQKSFNVDKIILSGLDRTEVRYALNATDVVAITSHSEASNMVLKEALACNTPVISVDVGDAKKILQDMKGCYITSNDAHKLYKAVSKVLNKKGNSYSFRNKIKHLSNKIIASRIVDIYHVILTKQTEVKSL